MQKLTGKQEQFCLEYLVDLNATQAAIRAGYNANTAREMGHENLTKPHIKKRIEQLKESRLLRLSGKRLSNRGEVESIADRIIEELWMIAFSDPLDFLEIEGDMFKIKPEALVGEKAGAIRRLGFIKNCHLNDEPVVFLNFQDKMRAISLLMQHFGMIKTASSPEPSHRPVTITVVNSCK